MFGDVIKLATHGDAKHVSLRRTVRHALGWQNHDRVVCEVDPIAGTFTVQKIDAWTDRRATMAPRLDLDIEIVKVSLRGNTHHVSIRKRQLAILNWPPGCPLFCQVDTEAKKLVVRPVADLERAARQLDERVADAPAPEARS